MHTLTVRSESMHTLTVRSESMHTLTVRSESMHTLTVRSESARARGDAWREQVRITMGLADALKCKISDLPLSIVLSWYEQKAIAVLLTCLHLGLKPIRVGPALPAFVTQDVLQVLVDKFGIKVCADVDKDLKDMTDAKAAS